MGKFYPADQRYTVYTSGKENVIWFSYGDYLENMQFAWEKVVSSGARSLVTRTITDEDDEGVAGKLKHMRWLDGDRVEMWFTSKRPPLLIVASYSM